MSKPKILFKSVWTSLLVVGCLLFVGTPFSAQAQGVDILWQGETYTPPFYKGKSLWSNQSRITLVAITRGSGNPAGLTYKWTKNGTVLGNINGVGKNTLSFVDSVLSRPQIIKVDIFSSDQKTVLTSASVAVRPVSPVLAVYENNPFHGLMFHRQTGEVYKLGEREITFVAFPFFFSTFSRADTALIYEWRTNVGATEAGGSATYRTPDDAAGSSEIRVGVSNKDKIMQRANKSFLVQFGE